MPSYRSWYIFGSSSSLYFLRAWRMLFRKLGRFGQWKRLSSSSTSAPHEQHRVISQLLILFGWCPDRRFRRHCASSNDNPWAEIIVSFTCKQSQMACFFFHWLWTNNLQHVSCMQYVCSVTLCQLFFFHTRYKLNQQFITDWRIWLFIYSLSVHSIANQRKNSSCWLCWVWCVKWNRSVMQPDMQRSEPIHNANPKRWFDGLYNVLDPHCSH